MNYRTKSRRESDEHTRILVIEDNPADATLVKRWLRSSADMDYTVDDVDTLADALTYLQSQAVDAIVLDLSLSDAEGLESVETLHFCHTETPIIVMTGQDDEQVANNAVKAGAQDYLLKNGADGQKLQRALRYAIQRKRSEVRLAYLAQYDQLTNIPNRGSFVQALEARIAADEIGSATTPAVMTIDLDGFKAINDAYGHRAGDTLLVDVAQRLAQCMRRSDVVARLGGDEFAILLSTDGNRDLIEEILERIVRAFDVPFFTASVEHKLSIGIGVAMYPRGGKSAQAMLQNANYAMNSTSQVKGIASSRYKIYDEDLRIEQEESETMRRDASHAHARGQLFVSYQPIVAGQSFRVVGLEALLRWKHPTFGMVSPDKFIPLLERNGDLVDVGEWVLRQGCTQLKAWQEKFGDHLQLSVNVSSQQFQEAHFVSRVAKAIEDAGIETKDIQLEIKEGLLTQSGTNAHETLTALKTLGVDIAIDDFGTGCSQLGSLVDFPIDTLKIDTSIISTLDSQKGTVLTETLLRMAAGLNITVVAEGIEKEAQRKFLTGNQCPHLQGYLFSKPLAAELCTAWLDNHQRIKRTDPATFRIEHVA